MPLLYFIWSISIALTFAAAVIYIILIIRRLIDEFFEKKTFKDLKLLQLKIFTLLEMDDKYFHRAIKKTPIFTKRQLPEVNSLCVRLCFILKGRHKEKLVQIMINNDFNYECLIDIKKGNPDERHAAAIALQYFDDPTTEKALKKALNDSSVEVSFASATSLLMRNALDDLNNLVAIFSAKNQLDSLHCYQLFRLISMYSPKLLEQLLDEQTLTMEVKKLLAYAFGYSADYSRIQILFNFFNEDNAALKILVLEAITRLEHPVGEELLLQALDEKDWHVQAAAITACGEIGLETSIALLNHFLESENWVLRFNAAKSLYEIGENGKSILTQRAVIPDAAGRISSLVLEENKNQPHQPPLGISNA